MKTDIVFSLFCGIIKGYPRRTKANSAARGAGGGGGGISTAEEYAENACSLMESAETVHSLKEQTLRPSSRSELVEFARSANFRV
ncbi:MAG: hypothetical protein IKQ92_09185 [Clostridia bacterium]|nr:hypothetical protein [Clostridia bacterium]